MPMPRERARRLGDQVIDLPGLRADVRRVAGIMHVRGADDVMFEPGHDEDGAPIGASREQHRVARSATLQVEHEMRSAGAADASLERLAGGLEHRVDPRSGGVDDQPGGGRRASPGQHVVEVDAARAPAVDDDEVDRRVVAQIGARASRLGQIFQGQALRHRDLGVVEEVRRVEPVGRERRLAALQLAGRERAVPWSDLARREQVVEQQSGANHCRRAWVAVVDREQKAERLHEVRTLAQQLFARLQRFVDQPGVAGLEVAEPAVNQLGRGGCGAGGEVALLEDERAIAARTHGGGDRRPVDPTADDDHVVLRGHAPARSDAVYGGICAAAARSVCQRS